MLQTRDMILHWDKNLFHAYNNGELPEAELIEPTRCLGLYRNWLEVATDGDPIEPESLWKLTDDGYVLIDEDLYHCEPSDAEGFKKID